MNKCIEFPVNDVKCKTEVVRFVVDFELQLSNRYSLPYRTFINKLNQWWR